MRGRLEPFLDPEMRAVTDDDLARLEEIPMKRIHRFSAAKADENIARHRDHIERLNADLDNITGYTIARYENLKEKYGHAYPRHTLIRSFDNIEASNVAEANEKLYINREEGFIGTSLKKDEYLLTCSSIDDVIIFYRDGRYKVVRVADKLFVGKKHNPYRAIPQGRHPHHLQRHLSGRQGRHILHEALCRDRSDARPRI